MNWYDEWVENQIKKYNEKKSSFFAEPSTEAIAPFPIAEDLYYVGDKKVCIHLIRTDEGLILLDAGYPCAKHLLLESIIRLGFDPADVRWIILTHAHGDHYGASNEFRNLYGTKVALSAADAASMEERPSRAVSSFSQTIKKTPVIDRVLEDGEIFSFGGKQIRCVLTPGHTLGTMSFFFDVKTEEGTFLAGLFGGAGMNSLALPYLLHHGLPLDMPERMLESLEKVKNEAVTIHLGNHPYNNKTLEKRERQLLEGGNPFIDASSWQDFLEDSRQKTLETMEKNRAWAEEHSVEL